MNQVTPLLDYLWENECCIEVVSIKDEEKGIFSKNVTLEDM